MLVTKDLIQDSVNRQPNLDSLINAVAGKNPSEFEKPEVLERRRQMIEGQLAERPEFALERLIGKSDLLPYNYFEKGLEMGKAVGRILVKDATNSLVAYGTGFMISPVLMMTNKHVLPTDGDVHTSQIEFGYQQDLNGAIANPVTFDLDPVSFFYADAQFDFSIIAVNSVDITGKHQVANNGYITLNPAKGKVVLGEYLSVIQHPDGREKQIAIRENQVVEHEADDDYIWYKTDTALGSSGSPVFNDQWQLVALHHMGVPETDAAGNYKTTNGSTVSPNTEQIDADSLVWKANEGIRVSRIVAILQQQKAADPLIAPVLAGGMVSNPVIVPKPANFDEEVTPFEGKKETTKNQYIMDSKNNITFTVPLNITVSLGTINQTLIAEANVIHADIPATPFDEAKLIIDPDYTNRKGFDVNFLGQHVGLPSIKADRQNEATLLKNSAEFELKYHHFSVVLNKPRKMAWFTAVNIDAISWAKLKDKIPARKDIGADTWNLDPRLNDADQIHKEFYKGNDFDIGHQVRREDPIWGDTLEFAIKCNNDTFHLANACPQHKEFNQGTGPADPGDVTTGKTLWQGLENYILDNAHKNGLKVNVYTGPVFGDNDKVFQQTGIKIPEAFWKVVVLEKSSGGLSATAYLVSQASLIKQMMEDFVFGKYRTYQVAVKHIEELTGLSFGLAEFDPLNHLPLDANEALELKKPEKVKLLNSVHDIVF